MQNAMKLFGPVDNFSAPIIVLTLLSFSVLVCSFISLGYPIKLFFIQKEYKKAIRVVAFTTVFLFLFLALVIGALAIFK